MKGIFIPDITVEMFRNGCLEAIEALMAEGEIYDIEYDPKSEGQDVTDRNVGDMISRQAAIESLGEEPMVWNDEYHEITEREQWRRDVAAIEAVPSAQPQIIRCKDCTWWTNQSTTLQGKCRLHNLNPMPEWYCASGEVGE